MARKKGLDELFMSLYNAIGILLRRYSMETNHLLKIGDAREALKSLNSSSVQLVVTSPPYWNIKDYSTDNQIGFGQSYDEYQSALTSIWKECKRIISPGCKMAINVGDQFLRANENNGRYEIVPIHTDIIAACKSIGFIFLGNIIWKKMTTTKTSGGCSWMGSIYYPRDGYITYEHEYIMLFKKPGKGPIPSDSKKKELSRLPKEFRSKWFRGVWDDISPARQIGHNAMFPLELPERLIRMFTFAGETVLDPFVGSGTTMEAAEKWYRNSIGIEINHEYLSMIIDRISNIKIIDEMYIKEKVG